MDLDEQIAEAIKAELQRQADNGALTLGGDENGRITVNGSIDLDSLVQVVIGHVAGGP